MPQISRENWEYVSLICVAGLAGVTFVAYAFNLSPVLIGIGAFSTGIVVAMYFARRRVWILYVLLAVASFTLGGWLAVGFSHRLVTTAGPIIGLVVGLGGLYRARQFRAAVSS